MSKLKKEKKMLKHPVIENLRALKLQGMLEALNAQEAMPESKTMCFEERFCQKWDVT